MRSGHIKIIKQLIEYKADIHAAGNTGTPLDVGLQSQDPQIVQLVQGFYFLTILFIYFF